MKKHIEPYLCIIFLSSIFVVFVPLIVNSQTVSVNPSEVIKKSDYILYGDSLTADIEIKVFRNNKEINTMKMHAFLKGNKKLILFFYYPLRNKNRALLKNGENLWIYIPTNRRFMKIGSKQRMGSSDFSYGDILNVNLSDDYSAKILEENHKYKDHLCYKLKLTAKHSHATYAKVICYVRKTDYAPICREFFTKSGKLFKKMEFDKFNGARPMLFIMSNILNKNEYSTLEYFNLKLNEKVDDMMFTKAYIQRRR